MATIEVYVRLEEIYKPFLRRKVEDKTKTADLVQHFCETFAERYRTTQEFADHLRCSIEDENGVVVREGLTPAELYKFL